MNDASKLKQGLPAEQIAIRAKSFHPSGRFAAFPQEDLETSVPARFEKIARLYPDRIAVKSGSDQITYDDMNKAANRLARALLAGREKSQEPVALLLERGINLLIAAVAAMKAGKIPLHVDPGTSPDRIGHILAESGAQLILSNDKHEALARRQANEAIRLLMLNDFQSGSGGENLSLSIHSGDFAYIGLTSGATGKVKCAMKTHGYLLHSVMDETNSCHICAEDRLAVLGFNAVSKFAFMALLNGAAQYPLDRRGDSLLDLHSWLNRNSITMLVTTPTVFRSFFSASVKEEICSPVRLIRLGSEALFKSDFESYRQNFSDRCVLVYSYGSNETTSICDYFMDKNSLITGRRVPVGYLREGYELVLLDEFGNPVPPNEPGEIIVKSRFLASGYWQRNKLVPDKFLAAGEHKEDRSYFTNDIGRVSAEGCLEILGRKDSMVKIRGFRVDVGEVEAMLADHPELSYATVIAQEQATGDIKLVAYYVPESEPGPTVSQLRLFLGQKLPEYMIPSNFVKLAAPPLGATGKLDRKALPGASKSRPELDTIYITPATPVAEKLTEIWAVILSLDRVGINDNFFDLGGNSLLAARIVSRVNEALGVDLSVRSLFDAPTVAGLTAVIAGLCQTKAVADDETGEI
jgi:acyl-coenzyme A synthetase/AMP-(fatty) acid ligase/acyl carrier protein